MASSTTWWELRIDVPAELADDAAALLVDAGAAGVEVQLCTQPADGSASEETALSTLVASYTEATATDELIDNATAALGLLGLDVRRERLSIERREDSDWSERWKEHFHPLRLGERLWVVPSWIEDFNPPAEALCLRLDPGMAFGTGQHATTALCAALLEPLLQTLGSERNPAPTVLDAGCGSGILAIAAARLAGAKVLAIDNNPFAIDVARENVRKNDVWAQVHASTQPLADIEGPFDLVVANILAGVLIELAEHLMRCTASDGRLVLSGILATQSDEVVAAYEAAAQRMGRSAFRLLETRAEDEWVALVFGL